MKTVRWLYLRRGRRPQVSTPFLFHFKEREFAAKEKLEIVNFRGGAAFARQPIPSPFDKAQDEDSPEAEQARYGVKIPFELFSKYTAFNILRFLLPSFLARKRTLKIYN